MFEVLLDSAPRLFDKTSDQYVDLLFDNANTNYAEVRTSLTVILWISLKVFLSRYDCTLFKCSVTSLETNGSHGIRQLAPSCAPAKNPMTLFV